MTKKDADAQKASDEVLRLQRALAKAEQIRPRLHSATDELNAAIAKAEDAITKLQLGVSAKLLLWEDEGYASSSLTISKDGKAWRFYIVSSRVDRPDDEYELLTSCSREVRLGAVARLHDFVDKLVAEAEKEHQRVLQSTTDTLRFVDALKATTGAK